jgi:hypothetical protein
MMMGSLRELFGDKERGGAWSAGRFVAIMFALTYNVTLIRLGAAGLNIGWPWATLGIVILLAIPMQKWLSSEKHGPELVKALIGRIGIGEVGGQKQSPEPSIFTDDERG